MLRDGLRLQPAAHGLGVLGEALQGLGGLRVTSALGKFMPLEGDHRDLKLKIINSYADLCLCSKSITIGPNPSDSARIASPRRVGAIGQEV